MKRLVVVRVRAGLVIGLGTTYGRISRTPDRLDLNEIRSKQDLHVVTRER